MTGHTPNFDDWRMRDSISVYEIACLMNGYDPRARADVVVRDPDDPTSLTGIPLDTAWDEDSLLSALDAGTLRSAPLNVIKPDKSTGISVESLVPWLRSKGYDDLAAELDTQDASDALHPGMGQASPAVHVGPVMTEPERRLKALRELGGDAKWTRYRGEQQWCFTKITELAAAEARAQIKRSDQKTIRKDLTEAAEAERMVRYSGSLRP
jgi:hypothetical protein